MLYMWAGWHVDEMGWGVDRGFEGSLKQGHGVRGCWSDN